MSISSCQNTKPTTSAVETVSIDFQKNLSIPFKDVFSKIEFIGLQLEQEDEFLGDARKLLVFEGKFYVFDAHQLAVFVFDEKGNELFSIDDRGEGPGKYARPSDFTINPYTNDIEILDHPFKLFTYDSQGNFKHQTYLNIDTEKFKKLYTFHNLLRISESTLVLHTGAYPNIDKIYLYSSTEEKIIHSAVPRKQARSNKPLFTGLQCFFQRGDSTFYFDYEDNTIFHITKTNTEPVQRLDFGAKAFSMDDYNEYSSDKAVFQYAYENNLAHPVYFFNPDRYTFMVHYRNALHVAARVSDSASTYGKIADIPSGEGLTPVFPYADLNADSPYEYGIIYQPNETMKNYMSEEQYLALTNGDPEATNPIVIRYTYKDWLEPK